MNSSSRSYREACVGDFRGYIETQKRKVKCNEI